MEASFCRRSAARVVRVNPSVIQPFLSYLTSAVLCQYSACSSLSSVCPFSNGTGRVFLVLFIYTLIFSRRKNRDPMLNSTHIIFNFCISLLLSLIVFLTIRPAASSSYGGCTTTALLLHFFLMSTFLWTLMEGISMYRDFVIAIGVNTSSETFLKVAYSVSYGNLNQLIKVFSLT